jgi:hypothetical protein
MRDPRLLLIVLIVLMVTPVLAFPGPSPEEVEANRRVVGKWRADAEHYARLKNDLKQLRALPPERQDRMRRLDEELYKKEPAERAQLWRVMDRYVTWLGRLPPADRRKIEDAPTSKDKLQIIQQMRDKEWQERLPPGRQKEPRRLYELPREVQAYVRVVLMPALSPEERKLLDEAEGKPWPEYPRQILALAEKHPPVFPGAVPRPMLPKEVPWPVRDRLRDLMPTLPPADKQRVRVSPQDPGKWPDTAVAITEVLRKHGRMPVELGPCRPGDFHPSFRMQAFVDRLTKVLDDKEKKQLQDAEGRWPDYPRTLLELGNAHKIPVPGMKLPEPRDWSWEKVRAKGDR